MGVGNAGRQVGLITSPQQNQRTRSIAAHPCEKRKDGAPSVGIVHAKIVKGGPPAKGAWVRGERRFKMQCNYSFADAVYVAARETPI